MSATARLSEKLQSEGERILAIFGRLTEAQWRTRVYSGSEVWTIRDVLSHFISSERGLIQLFEQIRLGGSGTPNGFLIDRYNASQQEKTKDLRPSELLDQYKIVRANSVRWVSALDESCLEISGRHPFLGQTTLREMIKMLYLHNHIHYHDIKKALE